MSSAVHPRSDIDQTHLPFVVRSAVKLGILEALFVILLSFSTRFLDGVADTAVTGILLVVGLAAVILLPALWTTPRTIEGIAGAAGIGLGATVVFLLLDVAIMQPLGMYTNRWRAVGGQSNWWYHPVWWMVGTYLPWMGAFILANQASRGGASVVRLLLSVLAFTVLCAVVAVLFHFPGAGWNLGTVGVAVLPALALACVVSALGRRRA